MGLICRNCGREHPEAYVGNVHYCIKVLNEKLEAQQLQLMNEGVCLISEPVHEWFELSYAQYLTIPRSILQSMPTDWQVRFVGILQDLDETFDWRPEEVDQIQKQRRLEAQRLPLKAVV